jgi:hypothetical protein
VVSHVDVVGRHQQIPVAVEPRAVVSVEPGVERRAFEEQRPHADAVKTIKDVCDRRIEPKLRAALDQRWDEIR